MNNFIVKPDSIDGFRQQLSDAKSKNQFVRIVGAQSKTHKFDSRAERVVSTTRYSGIVDHQANDFTITVQAGTPVKEVIELLDGVGQHLPFDPVFIDRGATVGGMIGAGLNGPCRLRFGGLRDFVIGCQFIDGQGRLIRSGGKVVKNAAGFDLSKFLIGSAGKFAVVLEVTFKIFPRPRFSQTAIIETASTEAAVKMLQRLNSSHVDFEGLEVSNRCHVLARWSADSSDGLKEQLQRLLQKTDATYQLLDGAAEHRFWNEIANFDSIDSSDVVIKVPLVRNAIVAFDLCFRDLEIRRRFGAAGNVAILFVKSNQMSDVSLRLLKLGLGGQVVVGERDQFLLGAVPQMPFLKRVKNALDPDNRFGPIENERLTEVAG